MGGQPDPVAGQQKSKEKSDSESDTTSIGKTSSTATTTPTLPSWMTAGLKSNFKDYLGGVDQFGNAIEDWQAAGFSPDQLAGFEMQRQAALGPQQSAIDELLATAQGKYLYGGEGFNAAVDAAYRAGMPKIASAFGGAGRDDGGLFRTALAHAFSDPFAMQYGDERTRQQAAQMGLPQLSLLPGQTFQDIGKQYQQLQQYGENYPLETLFPQLFEAQRGATSFAAPFLGSTGKTTGTSNVTGSTDTRGLNIVNAQSTPSFFPGSQLAGIGGGVLSGAGVGGQIGGPYGAAGGALVGGLLGAFG